MGRVWVGMGSSPESMFAIVGDKREETLGEDIAPCLAGRGDVEEGWESSTAVLGISEEGEKKKEEVGGVC